MSTEVIYNETGIGDLKDKTPYYNFNIPYFDIATWHDYIEENFRSIDALIHYIYEIKRYKGKWENNTLYKEEEVVFIADENSQYNGRIVKIVEEHITSDKPFDEFYLENSFKYEIFADPNYAYLYANEAEAAKNSAIIAKDEAINAKNELTRELFTNYYTKDDINEEFYNKNEIDDKDNAVYVMAKSDLDFVKTELNNKIDNMPPSVTKVSELENDAHYITKEYVDEKVGNIDAVLDAIIGEGDDDEGVVEDPAIGQLLDAINGEVI